MKNKTNEKLLENTLRYRRTKKGVLTNMYHHMKSRHNIDFSLQEFHSMYLTDRKFIRLFNDWTKSNYNKQLKPSLDRIDNRKHYYAGNINMMTWAENRFKQAKLDGKRGRKPKVIQMLGNKVIKVFMSQRHAVKELGLSQGNLSEVLNGKRKTIDGYAFVYEDKELLK